VLTVSVRTTMSFDGAIVPWNFAAAAVARETVPSVASAKAARGESPREPAHRTSII